MGFLEKENYKPSINKLEDLQKFMDNIIQTYLDSERIKSITHTANYGMAINKTFIKGIGIIDNVDIIDTQIELMKLRRKINLRIEPHPFKEVDFNRSNPVANEILNYGISIKANIFV